MISEVHRGIKGVDITTSRHLFNPETAFWLADKLNQGKSSSD